MALCAITQSAGLYSIYGSHGSDSSSSISRREWENNHLLFIFFIPPLLRSWRQQAFQSVSKCKAKAPGDPGPIFNLVEAQTRVNAPVALYIYLSGLWDPPFERRNKSNMQQAYIHGVDSGSYIWSPGSADESLGIKWHQGEGEEDEDEITKWNCMDTSLQYSITTMPLTAENW
jgi:hypothetical protein